jgi:hypothetical protein
MTRQAGGLEPPGAASRRRNGAPPQRPAPESSSRHHDGYQQGNPRRRQVPTARAVGLKPGGVRELWLWIVGRCEYCSGAHAHRGAPKCGVRRAGCGKGEFDVRSGRPR